MPDATASPLHGTSGDDLAAPLLEPTDATAPDGTDAPPSEPTQPKRAAGVRRILQQSRPEWPAMAAATLCLVLAVLGQAVMPLLFGRMVDATSDTGGSRDARLRRYSAACAELALVVGVSLFFTAVRAYVFNSAGAKVVARLRVLLFGRMLAQETAWFDARETGDLLSPVWKSTSVSGARGTGIATPSSRRRVDGVEDAAMIQHERAVKF